jgi:hypothetical protein
MPFQTTVALTQAFGVPGELYADGPKVSAPYILESANAAYNIIGATAFTVVSEGIAQAGGTGAFAGILAGPKEYSSAGTAAGGTLAPTLTLPNYVSGELVSSAPAGLIVTLPASANIGDLVTYNTATGALATLAAQASFTATQATNTVTVSAIAQGNLGVGSTIQTGAEVSTIIELGTGTGGAGTYIVNTSQAVASEAMTANSVPASGYALIPNATVYRFAPAAAGLGVIALK